MDVSPVTQHSPEGHPAVTARADGAAGTGLGPGGARPGPSFWLAVTCLIGVDYFSTLAYQPSITFEVAGIFGPLATVGVILLTLFGALPVYCHVAGKSPGGQGSIALLARLVHGWHGKALILVLLGFASTDFLMTRTLSLADAAEHVIHNGSPPWQEALDTATTRVRNTVAGVNGRVLLGYLTPAREVVILLAGVLCLLASILLRRWWRVPCFWVAVVLLAGLPAVHFADWLRDACLNRLSGDEQGKRVVVTLLLTVVSFLLWTLLVRRGFGKYVVRVSVVLVAGYLLLTALILGSGVWYLLGNPQPWRAWWQQIETASTGPGNGFDAGGLLLLLLVSLPLFPKLSLGMSGFELSLLVMPQVKGGPADNPKHPLGRIANTRKALLTAALVMAVFLLGSVLVTTILIPPAEFLEAGDARNRALAYLAHGRALVNGESAASLNPLFGHAFGTLYDIWTVAILCVAGISVVAALDTLLPQFLHRFGMDLDWANRWRILFRLFFVMNVVATVFFRASVTDQRGAYATGVLALFADASLLTLLDVWRHGLRRRAVREGEAPAEPASTARGAAGSAGASPSHSPPAPARGDAGLAGASPSLQAAPAFGERLLWLLRVGGNALIALAFLAATLYVIVTTLSGLVIAGLFTLAIVALAVLARTVRSSELRTPGFEFVNEQSRLLWDSMRVADFPVLVPHRPGRHARDEKDRCIRGEHNLAPDLDLVFLEIELDDPSDFDQTPLVEVFREGSRFVIRIRQCTSIANAIAAVALEFSKVGRPPSLHFGWSERGPLGALWSFLVFGEGNVPGVVRDLLIRAEPREERRPRVVVG
jgi:hypothetical protein